MKVTDAIEKRVSVRHYDPNLKVNVDKILDVFDSVRHIPVAGNVFNLKFIVISEQAVKDAIAEAALQQYFLSDAQFLIVICSNPDSCVLRYGEELGQKYARQQAGAAIQSILLLITEKRLDSCWVGAFDEEKMRRILYIPDNVNVEAIITVGKRSAVETAGKSQTRKPTVEAFAFFNKWGNVYLVPPKRPTGDYELFIGR